MNRPTIIDALADPQLFGALPAFRDLSTWKAWLAFLAALYGLPFSVLRRVGIEDQEALDTFCRHTGRSTYAPPEGGYREAAAIVGRQAGKDRIASVVQGYEAAFGAADDGDEIFSLSVCQDQRASLRTQLRYARAPFERVPMLRQLVGRRTADTIELSTGITLASYPCRPQSVRGLRASVAVCSELAHFRSTEGYPTDVEMLRAIRPTLATTGGRLLILSSPYAQTGALFDLHRRHHGRDDSQVLVWQATAPEMNPTLPTDYLRRMEQDDPDAYLSEVLGEFRPGLSTLFDPETLNACVDVGVRQREPVRGAKYFGHWDQASGRGADLAALAIAHRDDDGKAALDLVRAWKPPFSPGAVIAEAAGLLRYYGLTAVSGDRFSPGFVDDHFRANGITYEPSKRDRSQIFMDLLPLVNDGSVVLLDDAGTLRELRGMERRRGNAGHDKIDHRPGHHDDRAVCVAGALTAAAKRARPTLRAVHAGGGALPPDDTWQDAFFSTGRTRKPQWWEHAPPQQPESDALIELRREHAEAEARERQREREHQEHVRRLAEIDEVDRLRSVVEEFGSDTVEQVLHRRLPAALRGVGPRQKESA